jgi:Zn-dependent peptidase ImmA (M78 family)
VSYSFRRHTLEEIRKTAREILDRHKQQRYGVCAVDIEQIVEAEGYDVLYRDSLGIDGLQGYTASGKKYILLGWISIPRKIRYSIAHEYSHKVLEADLWTNGAIPSGAHVHELSESQRKDIEENTWELAAELLEPVPQFVDRFNFHRSEASKIGRESIAAIFTAAIETAKDFDVIMAAAARRARNLGLISSEEHGRAFTDKILM